MRSLPVPPVAKFRRQTIVAALVLLLCAALAGQLLRVARLYSANWDEAHHLYDGYRILTRHDYRANAEVPPLVKLVAALPLLPLHPKLPELADASQTRNAFLSGRLFVFGNGGDRLLLPARMACILFSLFTALAIFSAGRAFFGPLAGLLALFLFVFDPNVIAHGALISTDMASAGLLLATVYAFYRHARGGEWPWLAAAGLFAGLAMVAKFTGILVIPILLSLCVAEALRQRSIAVLGRLVLASLGILACAWAILWAFYGFRYAPAPGNLQLSPALAPYLASLPEPAEGVLLAHLSRFHLLPEAFLWGLANTRHIEWEYTSYFLGRVYRHGPWQYFPLAFLIKSTLPLLLLLVLTPFVWGRLQPSRGRELNFLLVPTLVYFAVVTHSHFDIGARHLLPVYPFLYILAGATAALLLRWTRPAAILGVLLLCWQVVTTARVSPSYMAYGNEAWGGPLAVRHYLSDSNVDWGQQLKTVRQYLAQNQIHNCWFAYFPDGAVEPADYGISCKRLPTPSGLWWFDLPMDVPSRISGTVLLSESDLDGVESGDGELNPYNSFRSLKPVAILQDGVYVYRGTFDVPLAAAWVDIRRSGQAMEAGDTATALRFAEQAVSLAPGSPRTQLQLAGLLAGRNRWPEAEAHYALAQRNLAQQRPDLQAEELGPQITQGLKASAAHR